MTEQQEEYYEVLVRRPKLRFPSSEWFGIMTLIFMLAFHMRPEIFSQKLSIIMNIFATVFLIGGFIKIKKYWKRKKKYGN